MTQKNLNQSAHSGGRVSGFALADVHHAVVGGMALGEAEASGWHLSRDFDGPGGRAVGTFSRPERGVTEGQMSQFDAVDTHCDNDNKGVDFASSGRTLPYS